MLEFSNVSVAVAGTTVVEEVDLTVGAGELHVLMGPNGSGKSSLLSAAMGLAPFEVIGGDIRFDGQSVLGLTPDARARRGMGLAFQHPPPLEGVTYKAFAKAIGAADVLEAEASALDLAAFTERDLNVGFSGGETKRSEVLRLILQGPRLLMFDEPESGVDLEHVAMVGRAVRRAVAAPDAEGRPRAGLIITHTGLILDHIDKAHGHIMSNGRIVHSGDARDLFRHIQNHGYTAPAA
ncbi:MAG: ATP-binding cassette domain-containing protein [Pseudomonadota bacterium]